MIIAFLDKQGNVRPPETWEEVKEMYCKEWDSCSPCPYSGGYSLTHGGFDCRHPLLPKEPLTSHLNINRRETPE